MWITEPIFGIRPRYLASVAADLRVWDAQVRQATIIVTQAEEPDVPPENLIRDDARVGVW